jgi:hypothetical protein
LLATTLKELKLDPLHPKALEAGCVVIAGAAFTVPATLFEDTFESVAIIMNHKLKQSQPIVQEKRQIAQIRENIQLVKQAVASIQNR